MSRLTIASGLATYRAVLTQYAGKCLQNLRCTLCSGRSSIIDIDVAHSHENGQVKTFLSSQSSFSARFDITKDHHTTSRSRLTTVLAWRYQSDATVTLLETRLTVI